MELHFFETSGATHPTAQHRLQKHCCEILKSRIFILYRDVQCHTDGLTVRGSDIAHLKIMLFWDVINLCNLIDKYFLLSLLSSHISFLPPSSFTILLFLFYYFALKFFHDFNTTLSYWTPHISAPTIPSLYYVEFSSLCLVIHWRWRQKVP
jgi:hypothetical protein